jgi:hypothetical protein
MVNYIVTGIQCRVREYVDIYLHSFTLLSVFILQHAYEYFWSPFVLLIISWITHFRSLYTRRKVPEIKPAVYLIDSEVGSWFTLSQTFCGDVYESLSETWGHGSKENHPCWESKHDLLARKGKAIPLQAWTGPEGSRRLRLPDFKTIGTWRW